MAALACRGGVIAWLTVLAACAAENGAAAAGRRRPQLSGLRLSRSRRGHRPIRSTDRAAGDRVAVAAGGRPADRRAGVPRHPDRRAAVLPGGERAGLRPARAPAGPTTALDQFNRALQHAPAYVPALVRPRRGAAGARARRRGSGQLRSGRRRRSVAATSDRESKCCASGAPRTGLVRRARRRPSRAVWTRPAPRTSRRSRCRPRARFSFASSPRSRPRRAAGEGAGAPAEGRLARPGRPEGAVDARRCPARPERSGRGREGVCRSAGDRARRLKSTAKLAAARERAALARLPCRNITPSPASPRSRAASWPRCSASGSPTCWRGRPGQASLVTDARSHWAATWILAVARAGVMEPYPNHTFQPQQRVRRGGSRADRQPRAGAHRARPGRARPAAWQSARVTFADVPPSHPTYPAASQAVAAGRAAARRETCSAVAPGLGRRVLRAVDRSKRSPRRQADARGGDTPHVEPDGREPADAAADAADPGVRAAGHLRRISAGRSPSVRAPASPTRSTG